MSHPPTLIVIGEIGRDLVPPAIKDDLPGTASGRVGEDYAYLITPVEEAKAREVLSQLAQPWAIGATEIWEAFPGLRGEFICEVERAGFDGPLSLASRLDRTVPGDQLRSSRVYFEPAVMMPGPPLPEAASTLRDPAELYAVASYLEVLPTNSRLSLRKSLVFLCDDFSLDLRGQTDVGAGLHFLTPKDFIESTDFTTIWAEHRAMEAEWNLAPVKLPAKFSGAFAIEVTDETEITHAQAVVSRLIAAAGLTTPVRGRGLLQLRFELDGFSIRHLWREQWTLPKADHRKGARHTVRPEDTDFWRACEIVLRDTPALFAKANDDFRSLALETFGDSRHSNVPALQYVQTWMAIERLLSFKTETTAQLATVLCALEAAPKRPAAFDHYKKRYDLRSRIAHGYAFKRDQEIHTAVREAVGIFGRVFRLALAMETDKALKRRLLDHVLCGVSGAIDDDAASDTLADVEDAEGA